MIPGHKDLLREFVHSVASLAPKTDEFKRLARSAGVRVSHTALAGCGRAVFDSGIYQPHESGEPCLIVPVGERGASGFVWTDIWDLIAIPKSRPQTWARRIDFGDVLNPEAIDRAEHYGEELVVWSSPLRWLQSGGVGISILCPMNRESFPPLLRATLTRIRIVADSDVFGRRLKGTLETPRVTPDVRVLQGIYAHAS